MKILFVARHNSGDNDDEGAVAYALRKLGHEVLCIQEKKTHREQASTLQGMVATFKPDFCLFFKWDNYDEIRWISSKCPCVFWFFDLISNTDDPTLTGRMRMRRNWLDAIIPHCKLAFFTDGDEVAKDQTGKLRWLMQGADERVAGLGTPLPEPWPPILFTGMIHHGQKRGEHVQVPTLCPPTIL